VDTAQLMNPLVQAAIEALNAHNRQGWFDLFANDVTLTDDGNERDFNQWSDSEFFGKDKTYLKSIDHEEDDGLTIYGRLHSDRWGEFDTFMKFKIQGDKIIRLDVGQVDE
jgi:hypothetical protein